MITEVQKLEFIDWVLHLQDTSLFSKLLKFKSNNSKLPASKRKFGCGRGIFSYVADDFNEPIADFKDYMK